MNAIKFFLEGMKRFKTVGAVAATSKFTSKNMVKYMDFDNAQCLVELGAGDGSITKYILQKMKPETKLICFEINELLIAELRKTVGDDPRVTIVQDDAAKMGEYIQAAGFEQVDGVISAIPFVIIPTDEIIEQAHKYLKKGSKYVQLHYSTAAKKRYQRIFGNVVIDFVMLNVPPAFLHVCDKKED